MQVPLCYSVIQKWGPARAVPRLWEGIAEKRLPPWVCGGR
jgi:hypothetical protein